MSEMTRLLEIMARLRAPDGCPWDREQTPESLRTYVLEEAFEVADAIDDGQWGPLGEELGDLLLQVVFLSQLGKEAGEFAFEDVARGISDKLVRRHPHVFREASADTAAEVWQHWDAIKQQEKQPAAGEPLPSRLAGLPKHLPALVKAHRLAEKAARAGFRWPDTSAVLAKVDEETGELRAALEASDRGAVEEELGDLLFVVASLARQLDIDPEGALSRANKKFIGRFQQVEQLVHQRDLTLETLDEKELDSLWNEAKGLDPAD